MGKINQDEDTFIQFNFLFKVINSIYPRFALRNIVGLLNIKKSYGKYYLLDQNINVFEFVCF